MKNDFRNRGQKSDCSAARPPLAVRSLIIKILSLISKLIFTNLSRLQYSLINNVTMKK